jgi:hypothetical protein
MPRLIDLLRASALPSNLVQAAAKGSLAVPPREMVEILVYLAIHNKVFAEQAQFTLAGWDETISRAVASEPTTPKEVLDYMISPKNLRPVLLPALLSNPSVSEESLIELASSTPQDVAEIMLESERVQNSPRLREALHANPNVLVTMPAEPPDPAPAAIAAAVLPEPPVPARVMDHTEEILPELPPEVMPAQDDVLDDGILAYLTEHAAEISAEGDKSFQPIGGFYDELIPDVEEPRAEPTTRSGGAGGAAAAKRALAKKTRLSHEEERGSAMQKISKLDIKGRIQLAMKGNKEERSLLIRDGTKIVALAVLDSPKISDGEVERFASQKNVLEAVLRGIPLKRRFAKSYAVVRSLVFNPRSPLDLSLTLVKNLLVGDLRNLSANKEVSDTLRKLALKMFKQKSTARKG